jgi:uncharacterized protein with FMN-binding domain
MKKATKILVIILVFLIVVGFSIFYFVQKIEASLSELSSIEIEDIDLTQIEDGVYEGSYSVFPVSVEVKVTVENNVITDIEIIKHVSGQGQPAEVIILDVIAEQSLNVDVITDATYSSKVILLAIKDALTV